MNDSMGTLIQVIGTVGNAIAIATVAVKSGAWKGQTDSRVKDLEDDVIDIRNRVEKMDGRLNGMEKEFSKALARIDENLIFVKEMVTELKNKDK